MELCTWNLYGFVDQCHPNKVNKKEKKKKNLTSVDTHALEVLSSCLYIILFNLMTVVQDISYMIMCQRAEFNMFL